MLLAVLPTQTIASGTVVVAYLRRLKLDPAYQLMQHRRSTIHNDSPCTADRGSTFFSSFTAAALLAAHDPGWAQGVSQRAASVAGRVLILVQLKNGNDGLIIVVPFADATHYQLRPTIASKPDEVVPLNACTVLHPAPKPLLPLWAQGQRGIVQGVGCPELDLLHFRSIDIWQTASKTNGYSPDRLAVQGLQAGFAAQGRFTTEGVRIGGSEFGALTGARAVSLNNPEAFVNQSWFAQVHGGLNPALDARSQNKPARHKLLKFEGDINAAASGPRGARYNVSTVFSAGAFGNRVRAAAQVVASQTAKPMGEGGMPVITLTFDCFEMHQNLLGQHAGLLSSWSMAWWRCSWPRASWAPGTARW